MAEPDFLAKILHHKEIGNLLVYRSSFLQFLYDKLGIDKSITGQLFDFIQQPKNGNTTWVSNSHRRVQWELSTAICSLVTKINFKSVNGHSAFLINDSIPQLGLTRTFLHVVKGTSRETPFFLGMQRPPLGADQR